MKKWLVLICAVMMLSVTCFGVVAAESGYNPGEFVYQTNAEDAKRSGDFQYIILNDGTVEIVKYTGRTSMLEIPSKINGRAVTSIGYAAFWECDFLREVKFSNSVTFIADSAFYFCSGLTYIHIPSNVVSIGNGAFMNCDNAAVLSISPGVTSIGRSAFCGCSSVTEVALPDTVSFLGKEAFMGCGSLTSFSFPDSALEIEGNPLSSCSNLTDIQVSADHPTLEVVDGVLFDKLKKQLICYPEALAEKPYSIPEGTTEIASCAFDGVRTLTAIDIPNSVVTIGDSAFRFCFSLTSIVIPEGVTSISPSTFACCTSLTSVVIPESVTSIGMQAFDDCSSLTSVVIPESVTQIGSAAFYRHHRNLTLTVTPGSYAEQYAIDRNIPYVCALENNIPDVYAVEATPAPAAEEGASAPADAFWTCTCGSLNDYNFCPNCGAARPVVEPTCSNCGYDPEGETPNFCPACGTRF